jgi:hypothetical protein
MALYNRWWALALFPPFPRPERFLVAFSLRTGRSAIRADAFETGPAH